MNKKELTQQVQELLHSKQRFEFLTEEEQLWLMDTVLRHHPEWDWYVERKPKRVFVDKADHGTTAFYIEFSDGTKSSISFVKCIKNIRTATLLLHRKQDGVQGM